MASTPTEPPVRAEAAQPPRGYAAALRLALLWGPLATLISLQIPGFFTDSGSSNVLKTLVFFGTVACCLLLLGAAAKLEARRIHATSPSANLDLLRLVVIGIAILAGSVIATAFTGFEIVYDIS